jgi:hypothetical protein
MPDIELDVDRQVLLPGEALTGSVRSPDHPNEEIRLTLRGEEAFRPYVGWDSVTTVHEHTQTVQCANGEAAFSFALAPDLRASYASEQLRCTYSLKAVSAQKRSLFKYGTAHMHLTVLPNTVDYEKAPHSLLIETEAIKLDVMLDHVSLEAGEPLTGSFLLSRLQPDAKLPKSLTFSLACIEESSSRKHRKVLWRLEETVQPTEGMVYPLLGSFEFPTEASSPTTGDWITFKVHSGFRFRVDWEDNHLRESLPIQLFHPLRPQEPWVGGPIEPRRESAASSEKP